MSHLTKEWILKIQREAFGNASDTFELTPTLASWRDLEVESVAWMRANVMPEEALVALLTPHHSSTWSTQLAGAVQGHQWTVQGLEAALAGK